MTTTTAAQKAALLNILRIKIDNIGKGESRFRGLGSNGTKNQRKL